MDSTFIIPISILVMLVLFVIVMYNGLIRKKNEVENAFGGMDVQLKKRYDLIPNLVSSVKQYAKHEQETLTRVTELRTSAMQPNLSMNEKITLDNKISDAMKGIMLTVESYPELKANENFIHLQKSLNEVESQISAARRAFNAVVTDYNNGIQVFPNSIVANMMGLKRKEVFVISQAERENIDIDKLF